MKSLVSIKTLNEVKPLAKCGVDIIDVKNPDEGSLGASFPSTIISIKHVLPAHTELSVAIGDLPFLPGTAALASLGAAQCGTDYVKAGLLGVNTIEQGIKMMSAIREAVNGKSKTIACGYADYGELRSLDPKLLPEIAKKSGIDGILIDIKNKNLTLFDCLTIDAIKKIVDECHTYDLTVALAGSLGTDDVKNVFKTGADIIGCMGKVRMNGRSSEIDETKLNEFVNAVRSC